MRGLQEHAKRRAFAGMITHVDHALGNIVQALRDHHNMWDNTVLLAFSDNGGQTVQGASNFPLRGTKDTPWEGGTRVPAFLSGGARALPSSVRGTIPNGTVLGTRRRQSRLEAVGSYSGNTLYNRKGNPRCFA